MRRSAALPATRADDALAALSRSANHGVLWWAVGALREVWMIFIGNGAYSPKGFAPSLRPALDTGARTYATPARVSCSPP